MAIEVISWKAVPNVAAFRFPSSDFTTLSRLVVEESQEALVSVGGRFEGPFSAGTYMLNTQNFPFLEKLVNKSFVGGSPFKADVYYINKAFSLDLRWGTATPIQVRDPVYRVMIPVRAFGQYGIAIRNSRKFLTKLVGTLPAFTNKTLGEHFRGTLIMAVKTLLGKYFAEKNVTLLDIAAHQSEIARAASAGLTEVFDDFGIEFTRFAIASVTTDDDDPAVKKLRDALAKRAEMDIVGYDYRQERSFDALQTAAGNEGAGGLSSNMMGAGMGLALGAAFGNTFGNAAQQMGSPMEASGAVCPKCQAKIPAGSQFCTNCGSRLGEQPKPQTITCPKCNTSVPATAKFCPECGEKLRRTCGNCGREAKPDEKFCPECGTKL